MYTIGIDVGGTYTDLVAIDSSGATTFAKSPSTTHDQSVGVMNGLEELARRLGMDRDRLLSLTKRIVHGSTVATNALLERKGSQVAILTTEGHRDILEMREGLKPDRYDLRSSPPVPLVPRERRFTVRERVRSDGSVAVPLDEASLKAAIEKVRACGATSVAVCFLHSYRNASHEIRTVELLRSALPDVYISRSSDVWPQIKEYDRISTTVVNAYVGPAVQRYLDNLQRSLQGCGFTGTLFIILSHGGMAPVEEAGRLAAGMVASGPAGGIAACQHIARSLQRPDLIPFDMGGTSTDISVVVGGKAVQTSGASLAGERIALRSLDIISIAAGGGSIARVDPSGALRVGPESAGATPGPACYGQGGAAATVTDANVVLGYLDANNFMGGRRPLDQRAAEAVVDQLGSELGLSRMKTAAGIYRVINLEMAEGIRLTTVRRGIDPRRFTMMSFGGAAGLHAVEVARELEIARIIVPTTASVLSAWGMLATDLRYELSRTYLNSEKDGLDADKIREFFKSLQEEAHKKMASWIQGQIDIERSAEMRYGEQIFEIDVNLNDVDLSASSLVPQISNLFHQRHKEIYTYSTPDKEVVLVNARVSAVGKVQTREQSIVPASSRQAEQLAEPTRRRKIFLSGEWTEVNVYGFDVVVPGATLEGPAVVEAETTTVVLGTMDTASVNRFGWLDISVGGKSSCSAEMGAMEHQAFNTVTA